MRSRNLAGIAVAAMVATGGLISASPAQAAESCVGGLSKRLPDGSVKVNYSICKKGDTTHGYFYKVKGTLYDGKENGHYACVKVTSGPVSDTYITGTSVGFDTRWYSMYSPTLTLSNC